MRAWKSRNRSKVKSYWVKARLEVLNHYSKGKLNCKCCGENTYEFLSLDHIKNDGAEHRRKLGSNYIISYLKKAGWPKGFQVLCHNCNLAKGFYKMCPHKKRSKEVLNDASVGQEKI